MNDLYRSTLDEMVESRLDLLSDDSTSQRFRLGKDPNVIPLGEDCIQARGGGALCSSPTAASSHLNIQENPSTLRSGEASRLAMRDHALAQLTSNPELYAMQLAETVTGQPVLVSGFNPMYDLILKAGLVPALTPEGITNAHAAAADLAQDLKRRRKRSVASIIGRAKLTAEQADMLKAGTAASRILDMLIMQPTVQARLDLLPDCFTPPASSLSSAAPTEKDEHMSQPESSEPSKDIKGESEELWCKPSQLLSELEVRIRVISGGTSSSPSMSNNSSQLLSQGSMQMSGPELIRELASLRDHIKLSWLRAMQPSTSRLQDD
jgi:hypothetical protein